VILKDIEQQIGKQQREGFVYPQYEGYCFSNIPDTVQYLFGLSKTSSLSTILNKAGISPAKRQNVVALLLDGFGWSQWQRYTDRYEFLKRLTERGVLAPLTSIFPSTTATAVTTIHSGLTPQEHGLLEWWVYFEELGQVIATLPFRPLDGDRQDQLLESGTNPRSLVDGNTYYGTLNKSGIPSYNLINDALKNTAYSSLVLEGSMVVPFTDAAGLMKTLCSKLTEVPPPAYFFAYWGAIDYVAHDYGVHSEPYLAEIELLLTLLQKEFIERLSGNVAEETVLLVFADHGQINVDPQETIYLNKYPQLVKNLRTGLDGENIIPWGSARDVFLAVEEGRLDETVDFLTEELKSKASVLKADEALEDGLFGRGDLHTKFKSRIGDILLLPEGNLTLYYEQPRHKEFTMLGVHGGLSPDEMLVPFAAAKISDLL
jgi:hypothetical protein